MQRVPVTRLFSFTLVLFTFLIETIMFVMVTSTKYFNKIEEKKNLLVCMGDVTIFLIWMNASAKCIAVNVKALAKCINVL